MRNVLMPALAAALVLLAALPPASAQVPASGLELSVGEVAGTLVQDDKPRIPYAGNATLPVTLRVGCASILQGAAGFEVHVELPGAPAWLEATPLHVPFAPTDCASPAGTGFVTKNATLAFRVTAAAPAVQVHVQNVSAERDGLNDTAAMSYAVAYRPDYEVATDARFPLPVRGGQATFNLTVTQRSNARSMVMVEEVRASAGSISGLASVVYETSAPTKTFAITYKAPAGAWSNATVSFKTYSHYLLEEGPQAGPFMAEKAHTWTFTNADAGATTTTDGHTSPLNGWVLVVAVMGAALVARRR